MTHIPSYGGNGKGAQGQVQIIAAAQQIPFPSNVLVTTPPTRNPTYNVTFTGIEGRRRRILALDDIYVGFTSGVTAANGFLVLAGNNFDITTRDNVWFVGATNTGVVSSSSLSLVPGIYSSSSLIPTSGFSSSSSSASPFSSSSMIQTFLSSSSGVFVPTYGQLFWIEEFDA